MSHVKLVVTVSTDGDDFAARLEALGPLGVLSEQAARLVTPLYEGQQRGEIRDIYGHKAGTWDTSEVRD